MIAYSLYTAQTPGENVMSKAENDNRNSYAQRAFPKDRRKVLFVALLKLAVDGLLYYLLLYRGLHKLGAFFEMTKDFGRLNDLLGQAGIPQISYTVYFIGGLTLAAVLYLLTIMIIGVRRRVPYLCFALLPVLDTLFVFQPSALLLSVALFTAVIGFLNIRHAWLRYLLCFAAIFAYGFFLERTALVIIPIYLIARLWQKHDLAAIRICVLALLVFCLLYQAGYVAKLYELHPGVTSDATFRRLFPDENYMGHVSYYLLDTLLTLVRIIFPVEVFARVTPLNWYYALLQLIIVFFLFRRFARLMQVDWKKGCTRDERLQADALTILAAYAASLSIASTEPSDTLRALTACYPLFLYLLFAADNCVLYPVLERDLSGSCPVVYLHNGGGDVWYTILQRAARVCGFRNVALLGDEANRGYVANWADAESLNREERNYFRKYYRPIGGRDADHRAFDSLDRHFALYGYMKDHGITRCFLCDDDVIWYANPAQWNADGIHLADTAAGGSTFLQHRTSPHCIYWTDNCLRQFLDFVLLVYRDQFRWLTEVSKRQSGEDQEELITDALLLDAWRRIAPNYLDNFRYRCLSEPEDGLVWDCDFASADNQAADEYVYDTALGTKAFRFRHGSPVLKLRENDAEVTAACLRCGNCKAYIQPLTRKYNGRLIYRLYRMMK